MAVHRKSRMTPEAKSNKGKTWPMLRRLLACNALFGALCRARGKYLEANSSQGYMKVFCYASCVVYLSHPKLEGKHHVDDYIRELGLPASFLYTGNFYENMVLRGHVSYHKETDSFEFRQAIILLDTKRL